jgi:cytochrome P450
MLSPANPIAAVTHPDPYPYYAELVATKPLYYDDTLGLWVASSAQIVTTILSDPIWRVRPLAEPVPKALLGSPAADIFRHLVRMSDGANHCPFKQAVSATLQSVDLAQALDQSRRWAHMLAERHLSKSASDRLADFTFQLPAYVLGSMLGVPPDMLEQLTGWIGDFVACLAPANAPERIERGKHAAAHLLDVFRSLLAMQQRQTAEGLLAVLAREVQQAGHTATESIIANGIGFLSQAYEATAGLIGNTLLALAAQAQVQRVVMADPDLLSNVIQEVLRYDPPIQNTRRFLAQDATVAGQAMRAGATVLVVLAAANRDPAINPHPAHFDTTRRDRRSFTFGHGMHACPGEALAPTIARAGVEQLIAAGLVSEPLHTSISYRASANARIPILTQNAPMG